MMLPGPLDFRRRSLVRATALVVGSLFASLLLAHWPDDPPSFRLLAPVIEPAYLKTVAYIGYVFSDPADI